MKTLFKNSVGRTVGQLAFILTSAGFGVAIGWALRTQTHPQSVVSSSEPRGLPLAGSANHLGPSRPGQSNPNPSLVDQLERDLAQATAVTAWLCWMDALERAAPSDFPALIRLAQKNPAALRFVAVRWTTLAPRACFDALVSAVKGGPSLPVQELAHILFAEWPKSDPEGAIAALSEPGGFGLQRYWQENAATTVINKDIERGLRLFSEWHIDNYMPFADDRGPVPPWAAADPRHAAEFALRYPSSYLSQGVMKVIGEEWGKIDPVAGALGWCEENLAGSDLSRAVAALVDGAGVKQVTTTAALIASMPPSVARTEGAVAVARQWFPGLGGLEGASGSRLVQPETVDWLGRLDVVSMRRVLDEETWSWATSDPSSMADFLLSVTNQPLGDWPATCLARQLARNDPTKALDWTALLPANQALLAGGEAYAEWRSAQPESATAWLEHLPSEDPRRDAFFQTAIRTMVHEPQAAEQLAAMNPTERAAARGVIEQMTSLSPQRRVQLLTGLSGTLDH